VKRLWDRLVIRFWRRRQQLVDLMILWPSLCERAAIGDARRAFRAHMQIDPAYRHLTDAERDAFVARLPAPTP
jgi:hypothetical protein